jgi:hypothetical protein
VEARRPKGPCACSGPRAVEGGGPKVLARAQDRGRWRCGGPCARAGPHTPDPYTGRRMPRGVGGGEGCSPRVGGCSGERLWRRGPGAVEVWRHEESTNLAVREGAVVEARRPRGLLRFAMGPSGGTAAAQGPCADASGYECGYEWYHPGGGGSGAGTGRDLGRRNFAVECAFLVTTLPTRGRWRCGGPRGGRWWRHGGQRRWEAWRPSGGRCRVAAVEARRPAEARCSKV